MGSMILYETLTLGYATIMTETAVHGCHSMVKRQLID